MSKKYPKQPNIKPKEGYDPNIRCPNCGGYLSDREFPQFKKVQRKCVNCGETYYEKIGVRDNAS